MKNIINKLLVLLLVLFVGISLTACDEETKDTTNKNVPYGTLSNDLYAKNGNITLSEKTLYDQMRKNGYDYFIDELVRTIVKPEQYNLDDVKEEIIKIINEQCYGTSDEEKLENLINIMEYLLPLTWLIYLDTIFHILEV